MLMAQLRCLVCSALHIAWGSQPTGVIPDIASGIGDDNDNRLCEKLMFDAALMFQHGDHETFFAVVCVQVTLFSVTCHLFSELLKATILNMQLVPML
jgi:hypothetical protein